MKLCLLDVGNTFTVTGECVSGWREVRVTGRIPTGELDLRGLTPRYDAFAVASVVPDETGRIRETVPPEKLFVLSAAVCPDVLDLSQMDVSTLGADRIANALALIAGGYPLPGAVIDAGSAITMEIVDEFKRFAGGAIAPGRRLMRRALGIGTAQVKIDVPLLVAIPDQPGRNTQSAVAFGIDGGIAGLAAAWLDAAEKKTPLATRLLTGGDASFLLPALPRTVAAPDNFTLTGLAYAAHCFFNEVTK